jgi:long-chain acyl-CoA synthetase
MGIEFLLDRFKKNKDAIAIIWKNRVLTYDDLFKKLEKAKKFLDEVQIKKGKIISLTGDFTPNSVALLLALIDNHNIIVPLNSPLKEGDEQKIKIAQVEGEIVLDPETDEYFFKKGQFKRNHELFNELIQIHAPGLVLFTSGTSGIPKAAVHNFNNLLEKFKTERNALRTINFLLFDHWGGLNTLFHTISNCGTVLALRDRTPAAVCGFIEQHKVELLPVSPSFLNLLIISGVYNQHDLSSLRLITYGTEPMPENTLIRSKEIFIDVKFQQTYGLIELGVLRSKSKGDGSLWMKLGGEGFELRVIDNILQIKSPSAMLGYMNAANPFTEDGFFITGDQVEVDGEYYKILGRQSEIINVGGDKVYPQEVENVLLGMDEILDATVFGEKQAILGNIVCVKVVLKNSETPYEFRRKLKNYCRDKMQPFKIPVKVEILEEPSYSERFKKQRFY